MGATACVSANMDMGENHQNLKAVFAQELEWLYQDTSGQKKPVLQIIFQLFCSMALENS